MEEKYNITYNRVPLENRTFEEFFDEKINDPNPEIADFFRKRYSTPEMQSQIKKYLGRDLLIK